MQHVSTHNSHLQTKIRTIIAITGWLCAFAIYSNKVIYRYTTGRLH